MDGKRQRCMRADEAVGRAGRRQHQRSARAMCRVGGWCFDVTGVCYALC